MDIQRPLANTKTGNEFIVGMTNRYSKSMRTIPSKEATATDVAGIFVEDLIVPYGTSDRLLTDKCPQFAEKYLTSNCTELGTTMLTTTAYLPQTNVQTEWYNRIILRRLRHYISQNQNDRKTFIQPLTSTYTAQTHATAKINPCSLVLTREPPIASGLPRPSYVSSQTN